MYQKNMKIFIVYFFLQLISNGLQQNITSCGFKCQKSGECVAEDVECDGVVDCADGTDETIACKRFRCPDYTFRCKYGACIDKILECNGDRNCRDYSDENTPNCRIIPKKCREDEFGCNSGECILEDQVCDGVAHCLDESDELQAICRTKKCPLFGFQCSYGACVDADVVCNNQVDCHDYSDEDTKNCPIQKRPPRIPSFPDPLGACILPPHPNNGKWQIKGELSTLRKVNDTVPNNSTLIISCKVKHIYVGESTTICQYGSWSSNIGTCERLCEPFIETSTTLITCKRSQEKTNCSKPIEGTRAKFQCTKPFFELSANVSSIICQNGTWNHLPPYCSLICGYKTGKANALVVNGTDVVKGDYPWHIAIYKNKEFQCGGSLISLNIILTAAHCITDQSTNELYAKDEFSVAAGKYYSTYNYTNDTGVQFSDLRSMHIKENSYKGNAYYYLADLAILITAQNFTISRWVQPVCLDWDGIFENYVKISKVYGHVTGWGRTSEGGIVSRTLKEITLPYVPYDNCKQNLPDDFKLYLTHDKICAGFINGSASVCNGDSGGGFVFKNPYNDKYYLAGIVSVSPPSRDLAGVACNSQQYSLYTEVYKYLKFVKMFLNKFNEI